MMAFGIFDLRPRSRDKNGMPKVIRRFSRSAFSYKHVLADVVLMAISLYLSLWLRLGEEQIGEHIGALHRFAAFFLVIRLACYIAWGVYQSMWRYIAISDAVTLAKATALSMPLFVATTYLVPRFGYLPRSWFIIDGLVVMTLLLGMRLGRRLLYERNAEAHAPKQRLSRLLIYGAGTNGRHLSQRIATDPNNTTELLGYIDDDIRKADKIIGGLQVLGTGADLEAILAQTKATDLVVAVSQPPPQLLRDLVLIGRKFHLRPQVINNLNSQSINPKTVQLYRSLELSDLLNRPPAQIDLDAVRGMIQGRRVLVTGAGGSIGSEVARQVFRFAPAKLILCDHSELNLYEIDRELRPPNNGAETNVVPLLLDIKDREALRQMYAKWQPEVVFHAAAYKHVHLVEANPLAAILNNIQGTQNLVELSLEFKAERFLMISTDKAVNPAGVMGATKRACELLVTLAGFQSRQVYSSVRFGNVLGSSGSLVPLLRQQIEAGGPLTLTHPDMTRYFMLIPEAVSLVLMSSFLAKPGDISVLRMGDPIRIVDVANSLMALMGTSEEDIPIVFTGVRPGEKMFEELYLQGDELSTPHPDILSVPDGDLDQTAAAPDWIRAQVERIEQLAAKGSDDAVTELRQLIAKASIVRRQRPASDAEPSLSSAAK